MQIDAATVLQIAINVGGLVAIYTGLKVRIEVIATKVGYIERRLKMSAPELGDS